MPDYPYTDADPTWASSYLWPLVIPLIPARSRVFEVGCGNGALNRRLSELGHDAQGVDTSESGIALAGPHCHVGSAYEDLANRYGRFDVVLSLEVIEHCFEPRRFSATVFDLLVPGGLAIVSTPFHGYLKNLALAVTGKLDDHFTALWDGGHIKFFSERTLGQLLAEAGFREVQFLRAGRIPPFAKSMIALARKPR